MKQMIPLLRIVVLRDLGTMDQIDINGKGIWLIGSEVMWELLLKNLTDYK